MPRKNLRLEKRNREHRTAADSLLNDAVLVFICFKSYFDYFRCAMTLQYPSSRAIGAQVRWQFALSNGEQIESVVDIYLVICYFVVHNYLIAVFDGWNQNPKEHNALAGHSTVTFLPIPFLHDRFLKLLGAS